MRKIIAIILLITAIVLLFTACKDDKGDDTTQSTLSTSDTSSTSSSTTTTAPSTTGATYVLTTNQNKQAPWYSTTRFVPTPGVTSNAFQSQPSTSVSNAYENITYPTSDAVTPSVSAITSEARTTQWSTIASTGEGSTTKSTTKKTTDKETTTKESTSAVEAEGMQVVINDSGFNGDGNLYAAIDSQGWGKIKSNSMRVPVYIDGVEAEKPGTLQISSHQDGDGNQQVYMDVSAYGGEELGAEISFTVPEGFLKNSAGTKYNYAFVVSSSGY